MSVSFDPKFIHFGTASSSTLLTGLQYGWKFEEASGDAIDVISSRHLVPTGAVSYSQTGRIGNCFAYNGSSRLVTAATIGESAAAFSVAVWFKTSTSGTVMSIINNLSGSTGFNVHVESNSIELYVGSTFDHNMSTSITDGNWHCFVFTYNGTNIQPYLDNVKKTAYANTYTQGSTTFKIGWDGSYYFTGSVDETYIWSKCLSDAEVAELWNSGNGKSHPF